MTSNSSCSGEGDRHHGEIPHAFEILYVFLGGRTEKLLEVTLTEGSISDARSKRLTIPGAYLRLRAAIRSEEYSCLCGGFADKPEIGSGWFNEDRSRMGVVWE
jgi:hypothetical protein